MRELNILIPVFGVFVCGSMYSAEGKGSIPTQEQAQQLAAAAWKEPIKSIDITFYREFTKVPEPIERIRKRAEDLADRELKGRSIDTLDPYEAERRKKIIDLNVRNWLETQKFPQKLKCRVRIFNDNRRTDLVRQEPNEPVGPNTPFVHSYINTRDPATGDFVSYHYAGDMKTAFISAGKWAKETIAQFADIPVAGALQALLGTDQGDSPTLPRFVPDLKKIQELARTGRATVGPAREMDGKGDRTPSRIDIGPDPNAPTARDRIQMGDPNHFPAVVLVCDKGDYSRVYRTEFRNATTNRIAYVRECDDFDANGFPHKVTETRYDEEGDFVENSHYTVIGVELNLSIPSEVFKFNAPEGYKVVDRRVKKPDERSSGE